MNKEFLGGMLQDICRIEYDKDDTTNFFSATIPLVPGIDAIELIDAIVKFAAEVVKNYKLSSLTYNMTIEDVPTEPNNQD